jgi:hypothetical protein
MKKENYRIKVERPVMQMKAEYIPLTPRNAKVKWQRRRNTSQCKPSEYAMLPSVITELSIY